MTVEEWLGKDNQLGIDIWYKKYRYEQESFEDWIKRVSGNNLKIANLILEKKFLYGGRILANRGLSQKGNKVTLSNCYVITPPKDNIESIFNTAKKLARTYSYGGGCGVDIGNLRPKGAKVNNSAKHSSGAVSFMNIFDATTGVIGQNGRRGALMISIPVNHPDVEDFIIAKGNADKLTNANISIRIDNTFMKAVLEDKGYTLFFKDEDGNEYKKEVSAKKLFRKICENNWNYAEPGILYWDRITSHNLLSEDPNFEYAGTNPCASW